MNHKDNVRNAVSQLSTEDMPSATNRPPLSRLPPAGLLGLAMILTAIFYRAGHRPDLQAWVPEFIALMLLGGAVYLVAVYLVLRFPLRTAALVIILSSAVAFRLCVLPVRPQLSDDVYRYQWEGRIQRAGINPYTVYPALADLHRFEDPKHPLRSAQYTPTVYPPLSENAFSWIETVAAYKRLFTALDLASVGVLLAILAALRQPAQRILIYAWNPTVVVSFSMCGHQDSLAIFTLLAATLVIVARKPILSAAFLALSTLSKFFAILLLPVFLKQLDPPELPPAANSAATHATARSGTSPSRQAGPRLLFSSTFAVVLILGYLPYLRAGRDLFGGLRNYAAVWEANDSLFRLVRYAGNSQSQAELVVGMLLAGLLAYTLKQVRRGANPLSAISGSRPEARESKSYALRAGLILTAGLLLLSPAVFPWYFTWSIPFLCFYASPPWLLMSVTAVLGYAPVVAYAAGQPYLHSPLILALEYGPVLLWLLWRRCRLT